MKYMFPKGFLWGSATSSHQVEGNNNNDWTEWESKNAKSLAKKAKTRYSNWQQKQFPSMFNPKNYISGIASNQFELYEKDFSLIKKMNHNTYRFSIEWSRIEPEEGKFDEKAIEHYRNMIISLKKKDIEPFVTLWHFTNPIWIKDKGGFENKSIIKYFARYVEKVIDELGDLVHFWTTFNEPYTYASGIYTPGLFPNGVQNDKWKAAKIFFNMARAHRKAYKIIHSKSKDSEVGVAHAFSYLIPAQDKKSILNSITAKLATSLQIKIAIKAFKYHDFIGFQYYIPTEIDLFSKNQKIDMTVESPKHSDLNLKIFPEGIYLLLKKLSVYNKPIYITENGIADAQDKKRSSFIKDHLIFVHKAIKEGVNVKGYFYWSLLDNFEWDHGFWPRYGLLSVDYKTQKRTIRKSALIYASICKNNGF